MTTATVVNFSNPDINDNFVATTIPINDSNVKDDENVSKKKRRKGEAANVDNSDTLNKVQLKALKQAILDKSIFDGQTESGKRVDDKCLLEFLWQKAASPEKSKKLETFDWLKGVVLDSSELYIVRRDLEKRFGRYCHVLNTKKEGSKSYPQAKIPTSLRPATPSELKTKKVRGLIQIQAYTLGRLLVNCGSVEELISRIDLDISREGMDRDVHLCKRVCRTPGHTIYGNTSINQSNDYCPSGVIVKGKFIVMCHCFNKGPTGEIQKDTLCCIRPGPLYNHEPIQTVLKMMASETDR
jgi:hypothetical protein